MPFYVNAITHDRSGIEYVIETAGPYDTVKEAETIVNFLAISEAADIFHVQERDR